MQTRRKVFISFHHADQKYKDELERILGTSVIHKSVGDGDINVDVSAVYIKRVIHEDYLGDASVCIVLVGQETRKRKHVDWEISGALNKKVGGYSGLLGICLPSNGAHGQKTCSLENTPPRLYDNIVSGYAKYHDWTNDRNILLKWIEEAFEGRLKSELIVNNRPQMIFNRS